MKYITTQFTFNDGNIHLEPLYTPALSLGEGLALRVISGNVRPTQIVAVLIGSSYSERFSLREIYPTVFEAVFKAEDFKDILSDSMNRYRIRFYITIDNKEYVYTTEDIIYIRGLSFGMDNITDVSELFFRLNSLEDELRNRK